MARKSNGSSGGGGGVRPSKKGAPKFSGRASANGKASAARPINANGSAPRKDRSTGPPHKRARVDRAAAQDELSAEDSVSDALSGEDDVGPDGTEESDLDSDADEALALYGEAPDSDEELPEIFDDDSELQSEDDEDIEDEDDDDDDEDEDEREDKYAVRVSRLSKRSEIQRTEEDGRLARKKLPVRGAEGAWNDRSESEQDDEDDDDDDDKDDDSEDEEGKALAAAFDEAAAAVGAGSSKNSSANRAIHDDRVLDKLRAEQAQLAAQAAAEEAQDHRLASAKAKRAEAQATAAATQSLLHGNRFGMLAPYAIMTLPKRSIRIHHAREQIAHLSQNVVNDPEVGLAHLRRLLVFAAPDVLAPLRTPTGQIGDGEEGDSAFGPEDENTLSNKKRKRELWKRKQAAKRKAKELGADDDGSGAEGEDANVDKGLPARPRAVIDSAIRQLAILSLMVVFADIIPGYRIRALTDDEKAAKVTQEVARRREWEEGLLKSYREFLEVCEEAIKARNEISSTALSALCHILTRATHFNYRQNLLRLIIARLSRSRARNAASASLAPVQDPSSSSSAAPRPTVTRGSWDADCTQCSSAIVEVLQRDLSGEVSLEVVRLLHRMIKEGGYAVDARVLDILLHLRLKEELGDVRASMTTSSGGRYSKRKRTDGDGSGKDDPRHRMGKGKVKPKDVRKGKGEHLSKKEVKRMREVREIEQEMKEAEAEVDKEEREKHHTETLKLLFVLYFSILKSPSAPSSLLCSALDGLCKYGHRINVDFFRDLIRVLRDLVVESRRQAEGGGIGSVYSQQAPTVLNGVVVPSGPAPASAQSRDANGGSSAVPTYANGSVYGIGGSSQAKRNHRDTLCLLLAAFDLLFAQGESLKLDLSDFIAHLYSVMLSLAQVPTIEDSPEVLVTAGDRHDAKDAVRAQRRDARAAKSMAASSLADLLFRALELALLKPRTSTLPPERLGSFVKRLLACALHWPAGTAVRALGIVRTLVGRDGRLEALFETEDRAVARRANVPTSMAAAALLGSGGRGNLASATLANLSDEVLDRVAGSAGPDEKGPLGAGEVAWEVVLLAQHVNEDVRDAAQKVLGSVGTAPKNPGATRRR